MKPLLLLPLLGCLATIASCMEVKWCVMSVNENKKCEALKEAAPVFSCVMRSSITDCLLAIKAGEADAITLDGGEIYTAGLDDYQLHPIIAEKYDNYTCYYYAVAVAKRDTKFGFHQLKGKKSCHTGVGKSAGWNIPIGTLLYMDFIKWKGSDNRELEEAVGEFFNSSCAPGATHSKNLCGLCIGDCSKNSEKEPYYNYHGAFQCLKDGKGEVAFVKHLTVPAEEKDHYELLCKDNTRKPIDQFENCNLAKVPSHAVVTRKDNKELAEFIWQSLRSVTNFDLFSSTPYGGKNLMFKDSAIDFVQLPLNIDHIMYLGPQYSESVKALKRVNIPSTTSDAMKWCAVGSSESNKCDDWSTASLVKGTVLDCIKGNTVDECLLKIMHKEADAMAVDGGQVYTAGRCGLVPAMVEQYDQEKCSAPGDAGSYYHAVAVIKKGSGLTWETLKGKRSCHTGIGRNAGWNIPMGLIYDETKNCNFSAFFSSSCAPGADPNSRLCAQCVGNEDSINKCKASNEERYYGYAGAFRCLAEGKGDVAFVKHSIVKENTDGNGPEWAKAFKSSDYELICPGKGPVPVDDFLSCHLAKVSAHAVVTRPEMRSKVVEFLKNQQGHFGNSASEDFFKMFTSPGGENLLFKSSTKCLQEIPAEMDYEKFLGQKYMTVMRSLRTCKESTSDLEQICTYNMCDSYM